MKPYPAYKPTGLKWLPEVPRGWDVLHIRELFSERRVKVSDKDYPPLSVSRGGIVPQIETVAKSDDGDNRKLVKKGDFVINSRSDRKSSSGVSQLDGSVSLINIVLQPREQLAGAYVHYLLKCHDFAEEFYRNGRGIVGDLWTTRYSEMKSISLPIPTLEEQVRISAYLDAKTAKFDRLIKLKEREIELLQEKKQVVISRAVKSDKKTIPVKYIVSIDNGSDPVTQGTTPVYGSGAESFKSCGEFKIGPAVLLGRKGATLHIPHYVEGKYWNVDTAFDAKPLGDRVDLRFFYYCAICFDYRRFISQTTLPSMTKSDYGRMRIPMLAMPEQRKIAAYLDAETAKTDKVIAVMRRQIELLREYRTRLISDAVTGRIDLRKEAC